MAHKTLIGGTAYEISGGKTLVNGTAYSIDKGKTLVGGTAYEIGFLITFTIEGAPYQAEDGMTWQEWVPSAYNTGGYVLSGGYNGQAYVKHSNSGKYVGSNKNNILSSFSRIIDGYSYVHSNM